MLHMEYNNDNTLVALLQEGNQQAFDTLYWKYHQALYSNILKLVRDTAAAEDILQDTFITFWQKRNLIDPGKSVSGWLFVISYNKSVNWKKRKLLEAKNQNMAAPLQQEDEGAATYAAQLQVLEHALKQLSPQKRRVLELCKLQGKTYRQTAVELNISSHTVKEYLSSAIASVKDYAATHTEYILLLPFLLLQGYL